MIDDAMNGSVYALRVIGIRRQFDFFCPCTARQGE
jgi:hypothetical protein